MVVHMLKDLKGAQIQEPGMESHEDEMSIISTIFERVCSKLNNQRFLMRRLFAGNLKLCLVLNRHPEHGIFNRSNIGDTWFYTLTSRFISSCEDGWYFYNICLHLCR
ncbi:hypothetical protein KP509_1Z032100 [Ceratopteris richardii]|nr:hypothetical protein KP509_1Z032100 [Ceratopteris richardii]